MKYSKKIVMLILGSSLFAQFLLTTATDISGNSRWTTFTSCLPKFSLASFKPSFSWFKKPEITEEKAKILKPLAFGGLLTGIAATLWKTNKIQQRKKLEAAETFRANLRLAADEFKAERQIANDAALVDEIGKKELTGFFTDSSNSYKIKGVGETRPVADILEKINKEKTARQVRIQPNVAAEEDQHKLTKDLAKDITEFPALGTLTDSQGSKFSQFIMSFKGKIRADGQALLRITFMERIPGTKQIRNEVTGLYDSIPCVSKKIKHMVVGAENADGTFAWKKTIHDGENLEPVAAVEERKSDRTKKDVSFDDDSESINFFKRWNFKEPGSRKIDKRF